MSFVFRLFFFILGELCPELVLVSSPVAKCAYKQHRYRNNCIATGSMYAWALSVGGVSPPLKEYLQLLFTAAVGINTTINTTVLISLYILSLSILSTLRDGGSKRNRYTTERIQKATKG